MPAPRRAPQHDFRVSLTGAQSAHQRLEAEFEVGLGEDGVNRTAGQFGGGGGQPPVPAGYLSPVRIVQAQAPPGASARRGTAAGAAARLLSCASGSEPQASR